MATTTTTVRLSVELTKALLNHLDPYPDQGRMGKLKVALTRAQQEYTKTHGHQDGPVPFTPPRRSAPPCGSSAGSTPTCGSWRR